MFVVFVDMNLLVDMNNLADGFWYLESLTRRLRLHHYGRDDHS